MHYHQNGMCYVRHLLNNPQNNQTVERLNHCLIIMPTDHINYKEITVTAETLAKPSSWKYKLQIQ